MRHTDEIAVRGVDAKASVIGGTRISIMGAVTYKVDLAWTDATGAVRNVSGLAIGPDAQQEIGFAAETDIGTLTGRPIQIRYLPDLRDMEPIAVKDIPWSKARDRATMIAAAAIGVLGFAGVVGIMIFRRR
jgi:hypothetical protein